MEQQKLQPNEIDAHICQLIGIAKHDFCYFTPAELQSLRIHYLETVQAMNVPAQTNLSRVRKGDMTSKLNSLVTFSTYVQTSSIYTWLLNCSYNTY